MKKIISTVIGCFLLLSCGSNDFVIDENLKCITAKDGFLTRFDISSMDGNTSEYYEITWNGLGNRQRCIFLEKIPKCYTITNENQDTLTTVAFVNNRKYSIYNYSNYDATAMERTFIFKESKTQ